MTQYVLEILDGDRAGEVVPLAQDRVTLGRKPTNTVALKDEKASGTHAEVVLEEGRFVLRDLGSTNGTLLDGKRVQEVALAPGEVFQIGRVRICFRSASAAAATGTQPGAAGDLALHLVDAARLQRSGRRSALGLLALLVVLAGGGGALYWSLNLAPAARSTRTVPAQRVAANLLPPPADNFEEDGGWEWRVSGQSFTLGGQPCTGSGAAEASWTKPEQGSAQDHALARLKTPLTVVPGDSLGISVQARTVGSALAALRVRFAAVDAEEPMTLTTGTTPLAAASWQRLTLTLGVPQGAGRAYVELLALLPGEGAAATFDDAVVEKQPGGQATLLKSSKGPVLLGCGGAVGLRSGGAPVLLAVRPAPKTGLLAGLAAAGHAALSDAGIAVAAKEQGGNFALEFTGAEAAGTPLVLEFLADFAGSGVLTRAAGGAFAAQGAVFQAAAVGELLLGPETTRLLLRPGSAVAVAGRVHAGRYLIEVPTAASCALVVDFEAERVQAREALAQTRAAVTQGRFADALAQTALVQSQVPHDLRSLREAQQVRGQILADLGQRLVAIEAALQQAEFLKTRAAFARAQAAFDAVTRAFGAANLPDQAAARRLQARIELALAEFDLAELEQQSQVLTSLRAALEKGGESGLAQLVVESQQSLATRTQELTGTRQRLTAELQTNAKSN